MKLIMTVGPPRAGKSTWAKKFSVDNGVPVVNPDAVRLALHGETFLKHRENEVWRHVRLMVDSFRVYGYKRVILDATNTLEFVRGQWSAFDRQFAIFDAPLDLCIRRAKENNQNDLIPTIVRMHKQLKREPVRGLEGEVIYRETYQKV